MAQVRRSLLPLTGVGFAIFLVTAFLIQGATLSAGEPGENVISHFSEDESNQMLAAILLAVSAVLFLFFAGSVRSVLRVAEGEVGTLSAVAFAGAIVAATGILIFAALGYTLVEGINDFEPAAAQTLNALNANLFFPLAGGFGTFLLATGLVARRTGALPSWLAWSALILGVIQLTPVGFFAFLASIVWVLATSIVLWRGEPAIAAIAS